MFFKTLDFRQRRRVIHERQETNVANPSIASDYCLEKVSGLWHKKRETKQNMVASLTRRDGTESLGISRLLEFKRTYYLREENCTEIELQRSSEGSLSIQWSTEQCMCVRKLPKTGEPPERIRENGTQCLNKADNTAYSQQPDCKVSHGELYSESSCPNNKE